MDIELELSHKQSIVLPKYRLVEDCSFAELIGINVRRIFNNLTTTHYAVRTDKGVIYLHDTRKIYDRIRSAIFEMLTGERLFRFGAYELAFLLGETSLSYMLVNEIFYDSDNVVWFCYVQPPKEEGKRENSHKWPEREKNENPIEYRKRVLTIPGYEEHMGSYLNYEATIRRGHYTYDSRGNFGHEIVTAELLQNEKKEKVKTEASRRGLRVIDDTVDKE